MIFLPLIMFSDFIQVLNSARKFYTKDNYFWQHKLFSTISLLQKQILNPKKYSKQELIMKIYVWVTNTDMNIHAKTQNILKHRYL
jgi:hypothetical protein